MIQLPMTETIGGALLLLVGLYILRSLFAIDRDRSTPLSLRDLITDERTGGMSLWKVVLIAGVIIMSWAVIIAALNHTMTDGMFGCYGATVVAASIAKIAMGNQPPKPLEPEQKE